MKWLWLQEHVRRPKEKDYAQRVLDGYRLGMKARGEISGVRIIPGSDKCRVASHISGRTYLPDEAPAIPVPECDLAEGCRCAYTPVMTYETERETIS